MSRKSGGWLIGTLAIAAALVAAGFKYGQGWIPWLQHDEAKQTAAEPEEVAGPTDKVIVGDQAQKNLKITATSLKATTFWKTITIPGTIVDRPGVSDRDVVAPAVGVVSNIHHVPG